AMCRRPDAAGTTSTPLGPSMMTSSSVQRPATRSARVNFGCRPRMTSMLARPRSASSSSVRLPMPASATAMLADTLVLPTPPLPPDTAIVRTGPGGSGRVADSGKVVVSLAYSRDCMVQLRVAGHIGRAAQIFKAKYQVGRAGPVQVLGNILAIGDPGDRQAMVH